MPAPTRRPTMVDADDVREDGSLLSSDDIRRAKQYAEQLASLERTGLVGAIAESGNGQSVRPVKLHAGAYNSKYSRKIGLPFSIIEADGNKTYAIYKGGDKVLGEGGFGKVKIAQKLDTKEWFAVKVIHHNLESESLALDHELEMMAKAGLSTGQAIINNDHELKRYIFMPLAKGVNLDQYLRTSSAFKGPLVKKVAVLSSAAQALIELHDKGIVHRDIKPANLMVDLKTNTVQLVDFGACASIDGQGHVPLVATEEYLCPEDFYSATSIDTSRDDYAFGITFGESLTDRYLDDVRPRLGDRPGPGDYRHALLDTLKTEFKEDQPYLLGCEAEFKHLMQLFERTTAPDASERLSLKGLKVELDQIKVLLDSWNNVSECFQRSIEMLDSVTDLSRVEALMTELQPELQEIMTLQDLTLKSARLKAVLPKSLALVEMTHMGFGLKDKLQANLKQLDLPTPPLISSPLMMLKRSQSSSALSSEPKPKVFKNPPRHSR